MCWFALVRKIWAFLATSHAPITDNKNLTNKPYICLSLLANLADIMRLVDARTIILDIFDPFYLLRDGIPLDALGGC